MQSKVAKGHITEGKKNKQHIYYSQLNVLYFNLTGKHHTGYFHLILHRFRFFSQKIRQ